MFNHHRHRVIMAGITALLAAWIAVNMRWDWIGAYGPKLLGGLQQTLLMLVTTIFAGFLLSIPIGLVQVSGPKPLAAIARGFCVVIRGTPLLLQVWLLYYGLGSLFPYIPWLRQSWLWPFLIDAWAYGFVALTISFAAYEGEIMRGAFKSVPDGELEAARALGLSRFQTFRLIWLPRALQNVLPTLNGELIIHLKSTPLVATITVVDLFAVFSKIRQETYIIYEPLILMALIYLAIAGCITAVFMLLEKRAARTRMG